MMDKKLQEQVEKIMQSDVPSRHTFFQLNFFILGKEPTHQAKLKRCVDELQVKRKTVDAMIMEIEDIKDKNELIYWEMDNARFQDDKERQIRCRMADRKIAANNKAIDDLQSKTKYAEEEMIFFVEAFNRLSEIESIKQWDDIDVQTEYWNAKLFEEINHRILMQLPIDVEILRTALALPNDSGIRKRVMMLLDRQMKKLEKKDN